MGSQLWDSCFRRPKDWIESLMGHWVAGFDVFRWPRGSGVKPALVVQCVFHCKVSNKSVEEGVQIPTSPETKTK